MTIRFYSLFPAQEKWVQWVSTFRMDTSQDPDDWLCGVSRQFSKQIMIPKLTKQCRPPPALFLTSAIVH